LSRVNIILKTLRIQNIKFCIDAVRLCFSQDRRYYPVMTSLLFRQLLLFLCFVPLKNTLLQYTKIVKLNKQRTFHTFGLDNNFSQQREIGSYVVIRKGISVGSLS
jgi:hypothetical protein